MIKLTHINCYYEDRLTVKDINLSIEQGEMVSIVGPSGCGKTTLLKTICGLHEEFEGQIDIEGVDVSKKPAHKRSAVMVFQEYLLYPHLTVLGNVTFGLKMQGVKKKERISRVTDLLEKVGLTDFVDRYPNELSGGQRQRVALARALAIQPEVLLLDEPFSNLDEQLRDEMRRFVCTLQKELGITTLFVTHDIEEALLSSDRVVVMNEGQVQQVATPKTLYHQPENYTVAKMLGGKSFIPGKCIDGVFHWTEGVVETKAIGDGRFMNEGTCYLVIPPEAIRLSNDLSGQLSGRIKYVAFGGSRYHVMLEMSTEAIDLTLMAPQDINVGDQVSFEIDWSKTLLLK